jgi:hypothetical protein
MDATVQTNFVDKQQDHKLFRKGDTWSGPKSRYDEINSKVKGALTATGTEPKADTKELKLTLETKTAKPKTKAKK